MNLLETLDDLVVFDDGVHVSGMMVAMKIVETAMHRTVWDGSSDRRTALLFIRLWQDRA